LSVSFFVKAIGQDIPAQPNPPLMVSDFVMKLKPEERNALEQKLRGYRDSTSTEISIVIVKNTGESDPYDYAMKIAKTWGVGAKDKNNGVLLLWATETRKIRIVTGRGIEDVLPDAICKRIINTILVPNFKQQQWYQGLNEATDEMIQRASGEFKSDATSDDDSPLGFLSLLFSSLYLSSFLSLFQNVAAAVVVEATEAVAGHLQLSLLAARHGVIVAVVAEATVVLTSEASAVVTSVAVALAETIK
jgi:uncharacterized protein